MVDPSPWPIFSSAGALYITIAAVGYFHSYWGITGLLLSFLNLIIIISYWFRDIVRESTFLGHHTIAVQRGLRLGMALFIISEIMFFFSFFWAFFHSSLSPSVEIGLVWPPLELKVLDPYKIPLLNTFVLLLSGLTITWCHHALLNSNYVQTRFTFIITGLLAFIFTCFQGIEYLEAKFSISDGIYGSCFYMTTGFHGFHVLIGTIFIVVCAIRHKRGHFSATHHVGFECAAWYWHFVDVVWLFLYLTVYWWGNTPGESPLISLLEDFRIYI